MPDQDCYSSKVFKVFRTHVDARAGEILRMAQSSYSFEEWLNWEFYLACKARSEWEVRPKPLYKAFRVPDRFTGDLLVKGGEPENRVIVEVGLWHDGTGYTWVEKLNRDTRKLKRLRGSGSLGMQVILVVSKHGGEFTPWLKKQLGGVGIWHLKGIQDQDEGPTFVFPGKPEAGGLLLRGWMV